MKTVLFVPGYPDSFTSRDYASLLEVIRQKGFNTVFIPITWKRTTIEEWKEQLQDEYEKYNPKEVILAGFSYGAMTALAVAAEKNPAEVWLFSLSSYFAEDLSGLRWWWLRSIGKRRVEAFKALVFAKLASRIGCKVLLVYGEEELKNWPSMQKRRDEACALFPCSDLVEVRGVGHEVAHADYIEAIAKNI